MEISPWTTDKAWSMAMAGFIKTVFFTHNLAHKLPQKRKENFMSYDVELFCGACIFYQPSALSLRNRLAIVLNWNTWNRRKGMQYLCINLLR